MATRRRVQRAYSGSRPYAQSKLDQIIFSFALARESDPQIVDGDRFLVHER